MATLTDSIGKLHDIEEFQELNWTGSFDDYLEVVKQSPDTARTAFQRIYDMILGAGWREYVDNKKKVVHYNFFDDEPDG
ncbi:MAG: serine protein kinase, partial [Myxococcota bacterium]